MTVIDDFSGAERGLTRRQLVQGIAAGGAALTVLPREASAAVRQGELAGTEFDLAIGQVPVNLTGRAAVATGVNGSVPAPVLRWRQGDTVVLRVRNTLATRSSIHWHGIRAPADMDGVPGLSFAGIAPGEVFTYRIPVIQHGTYWYHSHSGFQEQTGLYGALIVEPRAGYAQGFDREHVVLLSDWSDTAPEQVLSNLKFQSDYYNHNQRTAGSFFADAARSGIGTTIGDRLAWGGMRMSATDIADVTGSTYTYLLNGMPPGAEWTGMFKPGERVRLRFINGSAMTFFDVRIPGLRMTVVAADGNDVEPVEVDEFRMGVAETYDVIVRPIVDRAYTIFAQSEDRSGAARGTLATRAGMVGVVPPMDPRPVRSMADMGMAGMATGAGKAPDGGSAAGGMAGMDMSGGKAPDTGGAMAGMDMAGAKMPETETSKTATAIGEPTMSAGRAGPDRAPSASKLEGRVGVDNVAAMPANRLAEPGDGLAGNGRRVLTYKDLRATIPGADPRRPSREIVLHLTGNMNRYIWGFDGKKFSDAEPIRLKLGERVRITLINDTMMEHPVHLHGLWSELENGQDAYRPYKHTIIVQPGEKLSSLVTADTPGMWAYHCHLMYHMETGMFRTVIVA